MDSDITGQIVLADENVGFDTLKELGGETSDHARQRRAHERFVLKVKVVLQPGNSSEFLSFKVQGVSGDISVGGCQALFPVPVQVGDVYRLHFDKEQLDLPMLFVRCRRCRLINEDGFEAGFSFFSPITLPQELATKE